MTAPRKEKGPQPAGQQAKGPRQTPCTDDRIGDPAQGHAPLTVETVDATGPVEFLQRKFAGLDGFVTVCAIDPEGKKPVLLAASAPVGDIDNLAKFIDQHHGRRNLYWEVGTSRDGGDRRHTEAEVYQIGQLHVDIDPVEGKPFAEERKRIAERIVAFPLSPNIVIDSGGGYQCFWQLKSPAPVERVKECNRRLAAALGGDSCHSLDHLMRLPGTVNLPTPTKVARGRVKSPARLDYYVTAYSYEVSDFDQLGASDSITPEASPWEPERDISQRFTELLRTDDRLRVRWEGSDEGLSQANDRSLRDMSLAALCAARDFTKGETAAILRHFAHGKAAKAPRYYTKLTVNKAFAGVLARRQQRAVAEHLTDVGNARRLVRRHGEDIRFCTTYGKWFAWQNGRWLLDEDGAIVRCAEETARSLFDEAQREQSHDGRKGMWTWAMKSESAARIEAMVKLARAEPGMSISSARFDADPWLLGVTNGTVNLKTGGLRESRREDYISRRANTSFDPNAKCPRWLQFLDRVFASDPELIDFVQKAIGYSLTGDTSEQCLFIDHGEAGNNGKSTFQGCLREMLGDYAKQVAPQTFALQQRSSGNAATGDIARLQNVRFVASSEPEEGMRLAEGLMKLITGGDAVVARFMFEEWFEFVPVFKVWIAANHKPTIGSQDEATWRRIRLIPFNVVIPEHERDTELGAKLRAEWPGILRWAVEGCLKWQSERLPMPKAVAEATAEYRSESDLVGQFIAEACHRAPKASVEAANLYAAYLSWCKDYHYDFVSQKAFGLRIGKLGFERRKDGTVFYVGLRIGKPIEQDSM